MKKGFFDRRIPTVFALFLLIGGVATTMLLINQGIFTIIRATPDQEPQNVSVTNKTSTSFTVAFTTHEKTVSALSLSVDGKETLLFDDRDGDEKKAYFSHEITIPDLKPNSTYEYKILSNGTAYPKSDELFQGKTSEKISGTPENVSMQGKILLPDGDNGSDTLILITPDGGTLASVVTNMDGNYSIPASLLKTADGSRYLDTSENIKIQIQALRGNLTSTIVTTFIPNGTLPPISLSENYEFIANIDEQLLATPSSLFKEPDAKISNTLQVLSPRENETLIDARPQFRGTAPTGSIVKISIDGKSTAQLRSSPNGNWSFRSSAPLASGDHTLLVTSGTRSTRQNFSIFSQGSQIAQTATPSATLTPFSPSSTPTESVTVSPTSEPLITVTPTPTGITVTSIPIGAPNETLTPTSPTPTTFVPTKIPLPPTGSTSQSILLTGAALLFIVAGSVLFFVF